jgi:hypothetical protein
MLLFAEHALCVDRILSAADPTKWEDVQHATLHPEAKRVGKALHRDLKKRFCASKVNMAEKLAMVFDPRTKDLDESWCPFSPSEKEEIW